MDEHLSREEIEKYLTRDLAPPEILRIDDHLAACARCMQMAKQAPSIDAIRGVLESEESSRHLLFDTLCSYVDGELGDADREIADVHFSVCGECSTTLEELREMGGVLAAKSASTVKPIIEPTRESFNISAWWKFAIPAAALLVLGIFLWALMGSREAAPDRSNVPDNNSENAIAVQLPTPQSDPSNVNSNVETEPDAAVASLNDAGGRIEIDAEGRLSGISPNQFEQELRAAMINQTLEVSADARRLKTSAGTLMGPSAAGAPFRLIGPVGRVVEMDRPPFRWRPLQNAETYKVGIYDENFRLVIESPSITGPNWTPNAALPRGKILQWQVTAVVDGKDVVSPTRPAGAAKFKIVDAATAAEIQTARRTAGNSHLLMGIVYANAGMVPEAEREFQALLQRNPNSGIARKLFAKVRNAK